MDLSSWVSVLLMAFGLQPRDSPPPASCDRFAAPLIAVDTAAPRVRLEAHYTCLDPDGQLYFAYELRNRSIEPLAVRVRIAHFTPGGLSMGSGLMTTVVKPHRVEKTLSRWWPNAPFPLRGRDRFVAAIIDVEGGTLRWQANLEDVAARARNAARNH